MRSVMRLGTLCAGVLMLTGCEALFGPGSNKVRPLERLPRELSVAEQAVLESSNDFAFELLRETIENDHSDNVLLSPLSASMALGMTMNGARSQTFDEMRATLGFGSLDQASINKSYRSLIDLLLDLDDSVDMLIANSVWARSGFPFHSTFMDAVRESFDAEIANLDFSAPEASRTINSWVDRSTRGRIEEIVPESLPDDAVMYLINAIYFKGSWTDQFDPKRTQDAPFYLEDGNTTTVRMMAREGLRAGGDADVSIAELSYGRDAFVMDIIVPRQGLTPRDVIATLDAARWKKWMDGLAESSMELYMPKYRIEYETVMNGTLAALGMPTAFTDNADFTAMSPLGDKLTITNVKQKTFMNVDEEGTEAAAATSVEVGVTSMPPSFRVDRPFIVAIRERFSGAIMFIGVIGRPEV